MQEYKIADSAYFLTLTYDEAFLPRNIDTGYPTLDKSDVQKFIKRLRKISGKAARKIKYYAVGEYGEQTERPHYHVIIFNAKARNIEKAWSYEKSKRAITNRSNSLRKRKRGKCGVHVKIHV